MQYSAGVRQRSPVRHVDQDDAGVGQHSANVAEELHRGDLSRDPRPHERIQYQQVGVTVRQRRHPGAAVNRPDGDAAPLRQRQVRSDEGGQFGVRLEHQLSRVSPPRRDVAGQRHRGAAHVHDPERPSRCGRAVDDVSHPLQIVELQPERVVQVDVGLVGAPDAQGVSPKVRPIAHQPHTVRPRSQHDVAVPPAGRRSHPSSAITTTSSPPALLEPEAMGSMDADGAQGRQETAPTATSAGSTIRRPSLDSSTSKTTVSPSRTRPERTSWASRSSIAVWINRRSGRAPKTGSNPVRASHSLAPGVASTVIRRSASRWLRRCRLISTILASSSVPSASKSTTSSSRFRNSGLNACLTTPITALRLVSASSVWSARYCEPRLEVKIKIALRKSTVRPWPSVSRPSSRTWSRISKTSL